MNVSRVRRGSEEYRTQRPVDHPEESPEYTREEEEEAKVNKFVATMANMDHVPQESRPTALLGALGELVSSTKPTSVDIVTQSTNTGQTYQTETTRDQYENDRSKKDTTRAATTLWDTYYYDEYQSPTTEPNFGVFRSFIDGLKRATTKYRAGPPYRYQRYAEDNFKTNVIKRVLNLMHNLAINARQNQS